jgi:hypothetical protein
LLADGGQGFNGGELDPDLGGLSITSPNPDLMEARPGRGRKLVENPMGAVSESRFDLGRLGQSVGLNSNKKAGPEILGEAE